VPIRFRCAYCNQLMGISRRKAGTVVRCPTCSGQVVVPNPDTEAPVEQKPGEKAAAPNLFEQSDFDDLLRPGGAASPTATVSTGEQPLPHQAPMTGAWGTHAEPALPIERVDSVAVAAPAPPGMVTPATPAGLVLTPNRMTILAVVAVLLLGVAFGVGVLVGKFVL
jgi:hypothetical protein